ncbi:MAG: hypothetical protein FJ215_11880 [Ignavibacteria bacterium]|nr:hypothetical protein [Ignavibacteria bacterium]
MKTHHKLLSVPLTVSLLFFLGTTSISTQDTDGPGKNARKSAKALGFADEAVGVQTLGQLQNLTMNYGQITDTRFEDVGNRPTDTFFDFRYPRENFVGLCDDFSIFFAVKENPKNGNQGNVIDGWTDNNNEDWLAKDGSYGKTHYNAALDPNPHPELKWNNQVPYLAHSDLPATWPVDATGTAFWPGLWRRDAKTGAQIEGEFASDRDIYMVYTDKNNQQGPPIGIEIQEMSYNYASSFADKILMYEFFIVNKSGKALSGVYSGFYKDPDCSDHGEEKLLWLDSTLANGSKVTAIGQKDIDGANRPNPLGRLEPYTFGTAFVETPKNLGITSFHYFLDPGPTDDRVLWAIISSDPTNPNVAGSAASFFHGSNPKIDDVSLITAKEDLVWIAATGPFDMAPNDTVKFSIAVMVGDDDKEYNDLIWRAKGLFDVKFTGPKAPPAPRLKGVTGDRRVTLYWEDTPESFIDPLTGQMSFEGYKIYRSEDGGVTWGKAITDAKGRTAGYVPIAQFDLANGIKGNDPINPLIYLGDDTGLRHTWVDTTVVNGITYSYTMVSYDRGRASLQSLESPRGDGPHTHNFVHVTPSPVAQGKVPALLKSLTQTSGTGAGVLTLDIVDEKALKFVPYRVTFHGTPATRLTVTRLGQGGGVVLSAREVNRDNVPVVDGFKLKVATDPRIGGLKSITDQTGKNVLGIANLSSDKSWYVSYTENASADTASRTASYAIRFTGTPTIAYTWGLAGSVARYQVPFSVWNTTTNVQVCFEIQDLNNNNQWDEGELIFITRIPYPSPAPAIGAPNPATRIQEFAYQIAINNAPGDLPNTPPVTGTTINITSFNALKANDQFEFEFSPPAFDEALIDLGQIRVVPNPYVVTSRYESMQNVRELRFMYLPPECTIYIYTIAGSLVKTLDHKSGEGSLRWNLLSDWNQALAFGIYVYVVEDPNKNRHVGKFALIK